MGTGELSARGGGGNLGIVCHDSLCPHATVPWTDKLRWYEKLWPDAHFFTVLFYLLLLNCFGRNIVSDHK